MSNIQKNNNFSQPINNNNNTPQPVETITKVVHTEVQNLPHHQSNLPQQNLPPLNPNLPQQNLPQQNMPPTYRENLTTKDKAQEMLELAKDIVMETAEKAKEMVTETAQKAKEKIIGPDQEKSRYQTETDIRRDNDYLNKDLNETDPRPEVAQRPNDMLAREIHEKVPKAENYHQTKPSDLLSQGIHGPTGHIPGTVENYHQTKPSDLLSQGIHGPTGHIPRNDYLGQDLHGKELRRDDPLKQNLNIHVNIDLEDDQLKEDIRRKNLQKEYNSSKDWDNDLNKDLRGKGHLPVKDRNEFPAEMYNQQQGKEHHLHDHLNKYPLKDEKLQKHEHLQNKDRRHYENDELGAREMHERMIGDER